MPARRSDMFSPMVAIRCVSSPCTSRPVPGYGAAATLAMSPPVSSAMLGGVADELLEVLVAGDEVGLGVDLDDGAARAVGGDADQALGGDAAGLLGGRRQALGAQPVDRLLEVARDLAQRLLAIHHARAGLLAQFLDQRGGDLSHVSAPFVSIRRSPNRGRVSSRRGRRSHRSASSALGRASGSALASAARLRPGPRPRRRRQTSSAGGSLELADVAARGRDLGRMPSSTAPDIRSQ